MNTKNKQSGNVLFLILIAVALFAALSYAVTQSSRGSGDADNELARIAQAEVDNCSASIDSTKLRLSIIGGCDETQVSYELPNGSNPNPFSPSDKSCHVFSPGRGGANPCGPWLDGSGCTDAILSALTIGEKCPYAAIVYAGISGGNRIYTTLSNQGAMQYASSYSVSGAVSMTDGQANTDTLINAAGGAPYSGAISCRSLGAEWYLPARDELLHLYTVKDTGALNATFEAAAYWSSTESSVTHAWRVYLTNGVTNDWRAKIYSDPFVRCIRQ